MAGGYNLIPSRVFLKDLGKLPTDVRPRAEKALLSLKRDPRSGNNVKKLANVDVGEWRMRIGDFRLRYDVVEKDIHLHIIRHRKDVYRKK